MKARNAPQLLPLLPLRDIVVFPHMVVPLFVGRDKSIAALEEAMGRDKTLFLAAQRNPKVDDPGPDDIYTAGTVAAILQLLKLPDGTMKVLIEGRRRGIIARVEPAGTSFHALVEDLDPIEGEEEKAETQALMRSILNAFKVYVKLKPKIPPERSVAVDGIEDPNRLVDTIAVHLSVKVEDRQRLIEMASTVGRLKLLLSMLQTEIEILQVERKLNSRVKKQMERAQKEYYLNEQMRAIKKELGRDDEFKNEINELKDRIEAKSMPKDAKEALWKEYRKLKMMSPMSAEATVVRTYIDWVLSLPWFDRTEERIDVAEAERILNEDHYGLEKPKERILEYLAVRQLVGNLKGPILCLVGPPGVGKTSLARSIARATGRKFVKMSLGGVRDEAEIKGHRRTYIGALPGKIMQSLKRAGANNPVMLLDEIDKLSSDFRGDPSSALLEALDPEQNHAFNDHYIDLDYDLSEVMFITTANYPQNIPPPLKDRMEMISIAGYTDDEKLHIAKGYLVPQQMRKNGLLGEEEGAQPPFAFTDEAILEIIHYYTREAGVRRLDQCIAAVCRKMATRKVKGLESASTVVPASINELLGVRKYRYGKTEEHHRVGLATGLAYTEVGGDILHVEVTVVPGKGKLLITGKLGEVMTESANAAMSYIRSRAEELGLERDFYQNIDTHIHVPEGATPKDGPSAGITIATAVASALLHRPVRSDLAMTGEITLRGRVLPIGGLKEKLLGAKRSGIHTVLIPLENARDLEEIPEIITEGLTIRTVDHMDEVMDMAFDLPAGQNIWAGKEHDGAMMESGKPGSMTQ